jgi:hypothetical protein
MAVRLKSRRECPPGGFQVTIAKINQTKPFWSFAEAVTWFHGIATSNPNLGLPTDPVTIENFIDQQNALRMMGIPGADAYIIGKGGPVQIQETKKATLLKPLIAVGDKIRQLTAGAVLLDEWQDEGCPTVLAAEANRRAIICAACPQNGLGDLTRWFTVFASETIRKRIESAQKSELKTPSDDKLGICEACLCPLKLKVHVPLTNIKKHLTPKSQAALDPRCWILK